VCGHAAGTAVVRQLYSACTCGGVAAQSAACSTPQAIPLLYILSTADHIEIRNLKVNGGNCNYFTDRQFYLPMVLKFGQQLMVILRSSCHVLEAEIETDQGSQTYSFDP
jgi:hypothetical protein